MPQKKNLFLTFLFIGLTTLAFAQPSQPVSKKAQQPGEGRIKIRNTVPVYAPHKILVKFKPSLTYCPQYLLQKRRSAVKKSLGSAISLQDSRVFLSADKDRQTRLDSLIGKYKVKSIAPLYKNLRYDNSIKANLKSDSSPITFNSLEALELKKLRALRNRFPRRANKKSIAPIKPPGLTRVYIVEIASGDVTEAVREFAADPAVESVQLDYIYKANWSPNDPLFTNAAMPNLWGLKKMNMEAAWDLNKGEGVVVAVVDSGVDYLHFELNEDTNGNAVLDPGEDLNRNGILDCNIWINKDEIPNNGIDDDGNGYADDVYGFDFANNDPDPMDDHGHGTHVAGTIAALGNNGVGVVGVAPSAKIMAVKGLGLDGGSSETLAAAMEYAIFNGVDVINNSWGQEFRLPEDPELERVAKLAYDNNVVVVFAAGNSQDDVRYFSPNNTGYVLNVSAFDSSDTPASFTNYGDRIDVAAPGVNIISLNARGGNNLIARVAPDLVVSGHYLSLDGTSMAAPHVSGLVALIISHFKDKITSVEDVRAQLCSGADFITDVPVRYMGSGRVNAQKSLSNSIGIRAQITQFIDGAKLFPPLKILTVVGTVGGADFYSYRMYYASAQNPESWTAFSDETYEPKTNQILGQLDLSGLVAKGDYLIKLAVYSQSREETSKILTYRFEDTVQRLTFSDHQKGYNNLVTDGEFIYFTRGDEIWKYALATGWEEKVKATGSNSIQQLALADRWVVYQDENGVSAYNLDNGEKRQIASAATIISIAAQGANAAWLISRTNSYYDPRDIYLYDFITQQTARLTSAEDSERFSGLAMDNGKVLWLSSQGVKMYDIAAKSLSVVTPAFSNPERIAYKNGKLAVQYIDSTNKRRFSLFDLAAGTVKDFAFQLERIYLLGTPLLFYNNGLVIEVYHPYEPWDHKILYFDFQTQDTQVLRRPEGIRGLSVKDDFLVWTEGAHPLFWKYPYAEMFAIDRSAHSWPVIEALETQVAPAEDNWEYTVRVNDEKSYQLNLSASLINGDPLSSIGATFQNTATEGIFKMRPDFSSDAVYEIVLTAANGWRAKKERFYLRTSSLKPVWSMAQTVLTPQVNGNHLVWFSGVGSVDFELYYMDLSQPEKGAKNLSMDPRFTFIDPYHIELEGDKLFYRNMAFGGRLMSYDLLTQEVRDVSPAHITPMAYFFAVSGNRVVWNERLDLFAGYNADNIFLKDMSTGRIIELTSNNVKISKTEVEQVGLNWNNVKTKLLENNWAEDIDSTSMRFLVDFDRVRDRISEVFGADYPKILDILEKSYPPVKDFKPLDVPRIFADKVGWRDGNRDLVIYDISKAEQTVLPNAEFNFSKSWDISDRYIAWATPGQEVGEGLDVQWLQDIWAYDFSTQNKTLIAKDVPSLMPIRLSVSGHRVVWDSEIYSTADGGNLFSYIFLYDFSNQQTQRLSFEKDFSFHPFLTEDALVVACQNFYTTPDYDYQRRVLYHKFADDFPPTTTISYSPVTISGTTYPAYTPGTWTKTPVTVNLTAIDAGSGVKEIFYSLDGSEPSTKYTKPILLYRNGIYSLRYCAIDNAGNKEEAKSAEIKLDMQGILMNDLSVSYQAPSKEVEYTVTAIDPQPGSGIKNLRLSVRAVVPDSRVQGGLRGIGAWKFFDLAQAQGDVYKAHIPEETLGPQGMAVFQITAEDNVGIRRAQITDNGVKSSSFLVKYDPKSGAVTCQRRY